MNVTRLATFTAISLVLAPATAWSQADARAAAEALVDDGKRLLAEDRVDEACAKFQEAARIAPPGLGAMSKLAQCHERARRWATAWSVWREVDTQAARADHDPQSARAVWARERARELEPRLSTLTIDVSPEQRRLSGLEIERDGAFIGEAQWGTAVPMDPGLHVVVARAPKHTSWRTSVQIGEQGTATLVVVPSLVSEPVDAPRAGPRNSDSSATRRTAGLVLGASGIAVLTIAASLQVLALNDLDACVPAYESCPSERQDTFYAGVRKQTAANVFYALGGGALVTGIILHATAPSGSVPAGTRWTAGLTLTGLQIRGAF